MTSPFLERPKADWIASNELAFAIYDSLPVSPGHALVVPRHVIATWFEARPPGGEAMPIPPSAHKRHDRSP
jgi:diadenosine tetraphosphate (Ap4A) HIT family hydrolase